MTRSNSKITCVWQRLQAVILAGGLSLGSTAMAQPETRPADNVAMNPQASSNMSGMGSMSRMMRPDAVPPTGVVGGMHPPEGVLMPVFSYMNMEMDGNRTGTQSLSTSNVLSQYPIAPLSMSMNMAMVGLMYGVTDEISVMAMLPYTRKTMKHQTRMGQTFETRAQGFGDLKIIGGYDIYKSDGQVLELSLGLSLPIGSIDETDTTPAGPDQLLPYPMQLGAGTYDLQPGLTYTARHERWSTGMQYAAKLRLGENDEDYSLGDEHELRLWASYVWAPWLSTSLQLAFHDRGKIDGIDSRIVGPVQTADPDNHGGERLDIGFGINLLGRGRILRGHRLRAEFLVPLHQRLNGPQLEVDSTVIVRYQYMLMD